MKEIFVRYTYLAILLDEVLDKATPLSPTLFLITIIGSFKVCLCSLYYLLSCTPILLNHQKIDIWNTQEGRQPWSTSQYLICKQSSYLIPIIYNHSYSHSSLVISVVWLSQCWLIHISYSCGLLYEVISHVTVM